METQSRYNRYSEAMIKRFGMKVYKIPINLPVTCPNRDGRISEGGCAFCGDVGAGFECQLDSVSIADQFAGNAEYIGKKYNAKGFIAYLQNFSNTYMSPEAFRKVISSLESLSILGISISTRPDCISLEHLEIIKESSERKQWHVTMEYGLQTVNYHTLGRLNRGHGLAEFIDAVLMTHEAGFEVCAHMILNLPGDTDADAAEAAAVLSALRVEQVKLHGLYILRNTALGEAYQRGEISMISSGEYVERVVNFIRTTSRSMVFQRLTGRAPESETLFCNWGMSWWKLADMIEKRLEDLDARQGDSASRLGGSAVRQWLK